MATAEKSYTTIDKSAWPRGEWDAEPDKVQWVDETTGLDCLAVRQPNLGHWCGYVGVPPGHACHGLDEDRVRVPQSDPDDEWSDHPDVHGGLTFAAGCQEGRPESEGVCHVPQPGRPDDVWWFGFDCAHSGDRYPNDTMLCFAGDTYRTLDYVKRETASLAAQLVNASPSEPEPDAS